jgi:hypothetical protein
MRSRTALLFLFCLMSATAFVSCERGKSAWQGTLEEVDGVTVVNNPVEPLYGELVLELEEDLSIGNEEDDNYLFFRIIDILVDRDDNIYVLESGNVRIQKFDKYGSYLCTIGQKGQGPGEFQSPMQVIIDDEAGKLHVQDGRALKTFDKDGNYLDEDIVFEGFYYNLSVDSRGSVWGMSYDQEGDDDLTAKIYLYFGKLNSENTLERIGDRFLYEERRERTASGGVRSAWTGYEYELHIAQVDGQNMAYGHSKEYDLNVVDLDGNQHLKILKEETQEDFTSEETKKYERFAVLDRKPYFYAIFTDSEGRIYLQKNNSHKLLTEEKSYDIFSRDGYYIYKTVFHYTPSVIKDGCFYTRLQNEETGEVLVKRYRIKNWGEMKAGFN